MPPKRKSTKASPAAKKAKTKAAAAPVEQPTTTDFSVPAYDAAKQLKIVTWNVNSLKACVSKGFCDYVTSELPDILAVQETKANEPMAKLLEDTYDAHWNFCEVKRGYSGTLVLVKKGLACTVTNGMGVAEHDKEGRVQTVECDDFFLVNTYVPNSGMKLDRLEYRTKEWDPAMFDYLDGLAARKPVLWTGDLNCAPLELDIHNPKGNQRTPGFTPQERASFGKLLTERGYVDCFRREHEGEERCFTYWSYRFNCYAKDKGWRLDHFIGSSGMAPRVSDTFIRKAVRGSDHCPLGCLVQIGGAGEEEEEEK